MKARVDALRRAFTHSNLSYQLISSGAYFAYVRHPFRGTPAVDVARRLADQENAPITSYSLSPRRLINFRMKSTQAST